MIQLNGFWQVFAGGMLGVVLVELLQLVSWRQTGKLTQNYRAPLYWISTGALLVVSGVVAALNGTEHVPILKALQLGLNAPALLAGYASGKSSRARKKQAGFVGQRQGTSGLWQRLLELRAW